MDTSPLAPVGGFPDLPPIGGVRFAAVAAGVRYTGRLDVMLAQIDAGASVAGVFTRSATRAAPVLWCQDRLAETPQPDAGFAILVNAGNANAFTGRNGMDAVEVLAQAVSNACALPVGHVYLASTGVIGEPLPHGRITAKLSELVAGLSPDRAAEAAQAIRTTDTFAKGATATATLEGVPVTLSGFAKGSGMIAPDMATMLVYLFTDAAIARPVLQAMLAEINETTFNAITVDSDTSTSDTVMLVATAAADMAPISTRDDPRAAGFEAALRAVMRDLAHQVVRDGEGATKFIEITVTGAASDASAKRIGLAIANSPLVKTAFAGEDPNWGRIVMAVGKAGEPADRDRLAIRFGNIQVAEAGWVAPSYREEDGAAYMTGQELSVTVDVGVGGGQATVWTCDLTHGYIAINADYRS